MTERPHALALKTYAGMLDNHSASIFWLNEIIACGGFASDSDQIPERLLMEGALKGRRVASKLITAWQKDVAARDEWEEAERAAIDSRYRNMR
jgi:hypothetical protein